MSAMLEKHAANRPNTSTDCIDVTFWWKMADNFACL